MLKKWAMTFGIQWLDILTPTVLSSYSGCAIASEASENIVMDTKGLSGN